MSGGGPNFVRSENPRSGTRPGSGPGRHEADKTEEQSRIALSNGAESAAKSRAGPRVPKDVVRDVAHDDVTGEVWERLRALMDSLTLERSSRKSVIGNSVCAGLATHRRTKKAFVTRWTSRYQDKVRQINELLRTLPGWPPAFRWTALQLASDTIVEEHTDSNNLGPSVSVAVGDYEGARW